MCHSQYVGKQLFSIFTTDGVSASCSGNFFLRKRAVMTGALDGVRKYSVSLPDQLEQLLSYVPSCSRR